MIPVTQFAGARVGVLGLGKSGLATATALRAGGAMPVLWDDNEASRARAEDAGFEVADLTRDRAWDGVAALITSPGIPHLYPQPHTAIQQAQARGIPVDNDIGLFFANWASGAWADFDSPPRVICVTGSNGKSTTTALIHHCLGHVGRLTQMGGNIGVPVLDLEEPQDAEVLVLELSSYQTELARSLTPDVAVFLNLSPDHLDRHGGMGGYFAAKRRLFSEGGPDRAVIGVDEAEGQFLASQLDDGGDRVIRISSGQKLSDRGWSVFARKGFLAEWRKGRQVVSFDLRDMPNLPGAHNHQNACAAYAALRSIGIAPRQIEAGLRSYPGLPHRCQIMGEISGVTYVNDSKATNADAAEKALLAFDKIHLIAGGVPKAGGIDPLLPLMKDKVLKTYLIGEAAPAFAASLGDLPHQVCGDLASAFHAAHAAAQPGETVLLAPACASFDQFPSFEKRGEAFEALVAGLKTG